jgi:hypothetical protein
MKKMIFRIRRTIGELLKEFDGSQPVDEPPKYPGWLMPGEDCSKLALTFHVFNGTVH